MGPSQYNAPHHLQSRVMYVPLIFPLTSYMHAQIHSTVVSITYCALITKTNETIRLSTNCFSTVAWAFPLHHHTPWSAFSLLHCVSLDHMSLKYQVVALLFHLEWCSPLSKTHNTFIFQWDFFAKNMIPPPPSLAGNKKWKVGAKSYKGVWYMISFVQECTHWTSVPGSILSNYLQYLFWNILVRLFNSNIISNTTVRGQREPYCYSYWLCEPHNPTSKTFFQWLEKLI